MNSLCITKSCALWLLPLLLTLPSSTLPRPSSGHTGSPWMENIQAQSGLKPFTLFPLLGVLFLMISAQFYLLFYSDLRGNLAPAEDLLTRQSTQPPGPSPTSQAILSLCITLNTAVYFSGLFASFYLFICLFVQLPASLFPRTEAP